MKLTWLSKCLVAGLVTCALVSTAHAQAPGGTQGGRGRGGPGGGFGGRGGSTSLISLAANEAVQKELALGEVIKDAIKEIDSSYRDAIQKAMSAGGGLANFRDMSDEDRQKAMDKLTELRNTVLAKFTPELKDALSPEQFKRLNEIRVQALRDQAYVDADVAKALALKKEQQDQIAEINKDFTVKQREMFQPQGGDNGGARPDFTAMRTKQEEAGKARDGKLNDVLTKDQQAKLTELKGQEFDVAQLQPRGFGGPGGPGGGGPGGRPGAGGRPGGGARPPADAPKTDAPKSAAP